MSIVRTAVIGTGYLGKFHAQKYAQLDESELVAVVDIDINTAREIGEPLGAEAYSDYTELFGKVDAVSIVTPTESHHKIAKEFLSRGIDVLVEKPITVTVKEAKDLIKTADANDAILQVGHLERFNAAVIALEDKLQNPMFIESHRLSQFPNRATDVSVVLDLMIHDIDIILNLVNSEVETVHAAGIPVISDKVDIANARLTFKNGCVANVTASRVSLEQQRRIRLFQSNAYITIDYAKQHITVLRPVPALEEGGMPSVAKEDLDITTSDSLLEEIRAFLNSSINREKPMVGGSEGLKALEVAHKIQDCVEESIKKLKESSK